MSTAVSNDRSCLLPNCKAVERIVSKWYTLEINRPQLHKFNVFRIARLYHIYDNRRSDIAQLPCGIHRRTAPQQHAVWNWLQLQSAQCSAAWYCPLITQRRICFNFLMNGIVRASIHIYNYKQASVHKTDEVGRSSQYLIRQSLQTNPTWTQSVKNLHELSVSHPQCLLSSRASARGSRATRDSWFLSSWCQWGLCSAIYTMPGYWPFLMFL